MPYDYMMEPDEIQKEQLRQFADMLKARPGENTTLVPEPVPVPKSIEDEWPEHIFKGVPNQVYTLDNGQRAYWRYPVEGFPYGGFEVIKPETETNA
jgi:hypothetical protein